MMTLNNPNKKLLQVILLALLLPLLFSEAQADDQLQQNILGDDQLVHAGLGDSESGILDGFVESAGILTNFTDISVTKTDSQDPVLMSSFLNYTIFVNVTGNGTAYNITVNDTYPNQTIFLTSSPAPLTGTNNTWILGNLTTGTRFSINISLIPTNVTNNISINNSVNVTFQNETSQAFQSRNFTINTTIFTPPPILNSTNITVTKTDSPDPVNASQFLNYTINVSVTGNGTAYNVTVNDTYPNQTIYLNSSPQPLTGTNNTWILGNLTAGTNFRINISLLTTNVSNTLTINNSLNASFQNETSQGYVSRETSINTTLQVIVPALINFTNISVTKTDTPDPVNASEFLNYTVLVNITGNGTAFNVTVNDTYPNHTIYLNSSPQPLTGTNNTWILGNLTSGTSFSINISILVNNVTNNLTINNSINVSFQNETSQGFQSVNISINTSVNNFTGFPLNISNLSVAKTDSVDPVIISTLFNYTINVTSTGRNIAHNVTVNDTYPNEVIFQSALPAPLTGTNNTWILGNLSPGTSILINITVMLNNISSGAVINNTVNTTFQNATGHILNIVRTESTIVQAEITGCPVVINSTTHLAQLLRTNTSCIIINASNIELNCDGYRIIGNRTDPGIGINITGKENVTIRNCFVENFTTSIVLEHVNKSNLINQTCLNNYTQHSQNIVLIGSNNNTFNIRPSTSGVYISSDENSTDNSIQNSTFITLNGSIRFPGTIQIDGMQNISLASLNITPNNVFLNSTSIAFLNTSAEITLNAITLVDPTPTVDFEDDGTFVFCPPSVCTEISYANGMFRFNVTHFTAFSSSEGDPNVTLTKSENNDPAIANTFLNYTITINNTGTANASNLTLTDTYPNQTIFDASQPAPLISTNNTFVIGNLTQGQVFQVNITIITPNTPNGFVINNTANISFTNASNAQINVSVTEPTTITVPATAPSGGLGGGGAGGPSVTPTPITPSNATQLAISETIEELPANITPPNATKEQPVTIIKPIIPERKPLPEIIPESRTFWTPTHTWLSIATALMLLLPLAAYIIASRPNSTARRRREIFSQSTRLAKLKNYIQAILEAVYEATRVMLLMLTVFALILYKHMTKFLKLTSRKLADRLKTFNSKLVCYFSKPQRTTITPQERTRTLEKDTHKLQQLGFKIKGISVVQKEPKPTSELPAKKVVIVTKPAQRQPIELKDDIARLQRLGFKIKGTTQPTPIIPIKKVVTAKKPTPTVKPTIKQKRLSDEILSKLFEEIEEMPITENQSQAKETIEPTPEPAEHAPEPISKHFKEPEQVETPTYPEPTTIYQVEHAQEPQRVEPEKIGPRIAEETPTPAAAPVPKATERFITTPDNNQARKRLLNEIKEVHGTHREKRSHSSTETKKHNRRKRILSQLKEAYNG